MIEADGVHTVAESRRFGTIFEDVSEVSLTASTDDLCAGHTVRSVRVELHALFVVDIVKAWPSSP